MDYGTLNTFSMTELKDMASKMEITPDKTKDLLIKQIRKCLKEYDAYKKGAEKYNIGHQLGENGKEGTTYLVTHSNGSEYAAKTFKKSKSSEAIKREGELQKTAYEVSPEIIEIDTVAKRIIMQKMSKHVFPRSKILSAEDQKQIVKLHRKLDSCGVFHGDSNPDNYMYLGRKIYMIDFGLAKPITNALINKLGTSSPNVDIMLPGLVKRLKEFGYKEESYKEICNMIPDRQRVLFGL